MDTSQITQLYNLEWTSDEVDRGIFSPIKEKNAPKKNIERPFPSIFKCVPASSRYSQS